MRFRYVQAFIFAGASSLCLAQKSAGGLGSIGLVGVASVGSITCSTGGASQQTPFSLLQVQTVVQTLGNGTQIRNRTETRRMQDANGRTRIEVSRETHGAMQLESISIYDPAKRENITLHPRSHVAEIRRIPTSPALTSSRPVDREFGEAMRAEYDAQGKLSLRYETEQLAPRTILGERVVGVRSTIIMPAGERGNESELRTTHESWNCRRLNMPLLRISEDPITGHVKEEITELHFEAPDPALFQMPEGYRTFDLSLDGEPANP